MKTITTTTNYYTIEELKEVNPQGYENAYDNYVEHESKYGYAWYNEAIASVETFLELFECKLINMTFGSVYQDDYKYANNCLWLFNDKEEEHQYLDLYEIKGDLLKSYLQNAHGNTIENYDECQLTGYCLDYTLLEPLHDYLNGGEHQECSLQDLIEMGLSNALNEIDGNYEYQLSYEAFEENSMANDYYYDIDGNLE